MKKVIILFITVLIFGITAMAQDSQSAKKDTSSLSWSKVYNNAKDGLKGLASALKVGTEHVWEILVKQQLAEAITWTIVDIILLIPIITFFRLMFGNKILLDDDGDLTNIGLVRIYRHIYV